MALLTGASKIAAGAQVAGQIARALFPKEVRILIDDVDEVTINATTAVDTETGIEVSEFPSEDGKVFVQNISRLPRRLTLNCVFSSIPRLSNIGSLAAAAQFGTALAIPEVGSVTNILINEEDSVQTRLDLLRDAMDNGKIVQILGLPGQDQFNFIIDSVSDTENTETGTRSKLATILVREAFIVGLDLPRPITGGLFSTLTESFTGAINSIPDAIGSITGGISGI